MVSSVLRELEEPLLQCWLYLVVRAVCYEINPRHYNFFGILEKYNPDTCILFTPVGKIGFTLHEMFKVWGMSMEDLPYEKYIPSTKKLHLLRRDSPWVYETYWEVLCHFHICTKVTRYRSRGVNQMSWANYLFGGLKKKSSVVSRLAASTDAVIA